MVPKYGRKLGPVRTKKLLEREVGTTNGSRRIVHGERVFS